MISQIEGQVVESTPLSTVIDVHGVGFVLSVPLTTSEKIPPIGQKVKLFTRVVYREDSQTMYGFAMKSEREMFDLIVEKVSGIGPKIALNLLSQLSVRSLRSAIINADVKMLSKCPGIGKKTAERMVVELKDKLGGLPGSSNLVSDTTHASKPSSDSKLDICFADAVAAMVALGYNPSDADKSIRKAQLSLGEDAATEDLIRTAFAQKK